MGKRNILADNNTTSPYRYTRRHSVTQLLSQPTSEAPNDMF